MNVSWKLIRTSLAMSACVGLLAACQDRGAFKSKTWTPEQIKANLAAKDAAANRAASADMNNPTGAPTAPNNPNTSVTGGPVAPLDTTKDTPAPAAPGTPGAQDTGTGNGAGAGTQTIVEVSADDFMKKTLQLSRQQDANAAKTFKALTLIVSGQPTTPKFTVAMDMGVMIGEDLRLVHVAQDNFLSSDKDQKLQKLALTATDTDGNAVTLAEQQLKVLAVCKDLKCSELHIQIRAQGDNGPVLAVVARAIGDKMEIDTINVQLQSFDDLMKAKTDADTKAAADKTKKDGAGPDTTPTTLSGEDDKAGKNGKDGKDGDNGGSTEVNKTSKGDADKKADAPATPDKKADAPATPDKKADAPATPDKKADAPATTAPAAQTANSGFKFQPTVDPVAQKSIMFQKQADNSQTGITAIDAKPISKPITTIQDPGIFSFVKGDTAAAVNKAPATTTAPATTLSTPAAVAPTPAATVDDSAKAEKDNQATTDELKKEQDAKTKAADANAKEKTDEDSVEFLGAII